MAKKEEKIDEITFDLAFDISINTNSTMKESLELAKELTAAGYGNVKQAIKEFAERVQDLFVDTISKYNLTSDSTESPIIIEISTELDNLVKECGK